MNNDKLSKLIALIQSQNKGIDRNIIQERPAKVKKAFQHVNLVKRSTVWGRFVGYEKQQSTKDARDNGRQHRPNNWDSYQSFCDGLFKDHKGQFKVGIGHAAFNHTKTPSEWLLAGIPVQYEAIEHMLRSEDKEKPDKPSPDWRTLNADNITHVDGQAVEALKLLPVLQPIKTSLLPASVYATK